MIPIPIEQVELALRAASNGSDEAFAIVWHWCSSDLKRYCRTLLRSSDIMVQYDDDLVSDVMRRFSIEIRRHDRDEKLDCECAWKMLMRSAKTLAIDHYRYVHSRKRFPPESFVPIENALELAGEDTDELRQLEVDELWLQFVSTLSNTEGRLLGRLMAGETISAIARREACCTRTIVRRIYALHQRWIAMLLD